MSPWRGAVLSSEEPCSVCVARVEIVVRTL